MVIRYEFVYNLKSWNHLCFRCSRRERFNAVKLHLIKFSAAILTSLADVGVWLITIVIIPPSPVILLVHNPTLLVFAVIVLAFLPVLKSSEHKHRRSIALLVMFVGKHHHAQNYAFILIHALSRLSHPPERGRFRCPRQLPFGPFERLPVECHQTKTKVITRTNHNRRTQHNEPIRTRRKYM